MSIFSNYHHGLNGKPDNARTDFPNHVFKHVGVHGGFTDGVLVDAAQVLNMGNVGLQRWRVRWSERNIEIGNRCWVLTKNKLSFIFNICVYQKLYLSLCVVNDC